MSWFDIFKIQQGTFSTLVPKNMPKIRDRTPCRDRLNGIMDEIKNTAQRYEYRYMTSNNSSVFLDLIKVFNKDAGISTQLLAEEDKLPEPIHVDFTIPLEIQTTAELNRFDDTPEDVCCEFLKYLEESKKEVLTVLRNDIGTDEPIIPKRYKDWTFKGNVKGKNDDDETFIIVVFECRPFMYIDELNISPRRQVVSKQITIEFNLGFGRSGLNWSVNSFFDDKYTEEEFYILWMQDKDELRLRLHHHLDLLKKKDVERWFFNLDPMWWL